MQNFWAKKTAIILAVFFAFTVSALPLFAQSDDRQQQKTQQNEAAGNNSDQTMFYAFLQEDHGNAGPIYNFIKSHPNLKALFGPRSNLERKFRPMMQWRRWAEKRQRFVPAFLFIGCISFLIWFFLPAHMQSAAEECRKSFWKCFGVGLLAAFITLSVLRAVFISEIGWPLGIVIAGVSQAVVLAGLSVSMYNLGHSVLLLLRITKISAIANRPSLARALDIFAGALVAALLLQIPPIWDLPRCGSRLLALFALLGVGALCREYKRRLAGSST